MVGDLKYGDFFERVGEEFRVAGGDAALVLVLSEVTDLTRREAPSVRRNPFSLIFVGPLRPALVQRTWTLEHAALGRLDVFLVPIGPDGSGMRYEAIFN